MTAYRISGYHRFTNEYTVAQVQGWDLEQAMQLMGVTHRRLVCVDKVGVAL